ncbi:MAG: hypothetical protein EOO29_03150 [Comamonadaceae bacterium]|nr:MAG: hypothetical protein EOO29_03150 [Comamonadaceae bacterium]
MNTNHLSSIKARIGASQLTDTPAPWRKNGVISIGGLRSVGFDRDSELLLVVSSDGRGVIDCEAMEKISRDYDRYDEGKFLEAVGIGPLEGKYIRVSGMLGGGLPTSTQDGWSVESAYLDWPIQEVLLLEPLNMLYGDRYGISARFYKIFVDFQCVALGFSYTGQTLIIATTSEITVWGR